MIYFLFNRTFFFFLFFFFTSRSRALHAVMNISDLQNYRRRRQTFGKRFETGRRAALLICRTDHVASSISEQSAIDSFAVSRA